MAKKKLKAIKLIDPVKRKPIRKCHRGCLMQETCLRFNVEEGEEFYPELNYNGECGYYWRM